MEKLFAKLKEDQYKIPFMSAIVIGLITHLYMIVNKFPNMDSMSNFYFDQNMVTSGRWFLKYACGISSYYDLNLVNGLLAIVFLAISAVYVVLFFDVKRKPSMILISAVMVTFPAVAATMSYMYTVDGYMLGLLMAILAAYITKKHKFGFIFGAILLALSLGTYQTYMTATVLLCIFDIIFSLTENEDIYDVWNKGYKYLIMGLGGGVIYFVVLKIFLAVEHKKLDSYQGINEIETFNLAAMPERIAEVFHDFGAFMFKGRIFVNNFVTMVIMSIIVSVTLVAIFVLFGKNGAFKKWYNWLVLAICIALIPFGTNFMLLFTSGIEQNHLLMRMQWVFFIVAAIVTAERMIVAFESIKEKLVVAKTLTVVLVGILCYNFFLMDNIAYFNLQQRYEKTYAYCVRLLDRIEQTEGYYQGMPICMVGEISKSSYPSTDLTKDITEKIKGTDGDWVLYKGAQYEEFMKNYLGASLNILEGDYVIDMYYSEEYSEMTSFPDKGSIKIVNGIMYIKTE